MNKELENNKVIGRDLCVLARLLIDYGLCSDTSALDKAGQICQYLNESDRWHYTLDKIVFRIDSVGHRIPQDSYELTASLSIDIRSNGIEVEDVLSDPLEYLVFDIEVEGFRDNFETQELDCLYSSWHLDRHIANEGDGETKYIHPMYHFTFGGNKMGVKGDVFGDCLILPSPRIAHPPMDAILGIDFLLQNYLHRDKITSLISDPEYIDIIHRAQERLVKPYFLSIVSFWNEILFKHETDHIVTHHQFSNKTLYPFYY